MIFFSLFFFVWCTGTFFFFSEHIHIELQCMNINFNNVVSEVWMHRNIKVSLCLHPKAFYPLPPGIPLVIFCADAERKLFTHLGPANDQFSLHDVDLLLIGHIISSYVVLSSSCCRVGARKICTNLEQVSWVRSVLFGSCTKSHIKVG